MITVLLAAYQGERYLAEQLDSILSQTVRDLQILISDDGSTDGTWAVIEDYVCRYPGRIQAVCHQKTEKDKENPAAANFFWLLSQAEGDYLFLSDQDDVWKPDKVECMMEMMKTMESRFGKETPLLLYSDAVVADSRLREIAPSFFNYQNISGKQASLSTILVENPVTGGASMINQALLACLKQMPEHCFMHDWWIALTAACFGKVICMKKPLYLYRQHEANTLGAKKSGSPKELKKRVCQGEQVKENYRRMFLQASCFLEQFRGKLTMQQEETLQAFVSLPERNPIGRFMTIFRYHFYKSSKIQTLAQCFTIPKGCVTPEKTV